MALPPDFTFDAEAHVYARSGQAIPGVTDVIQQLENFAGIPASTLEYASARGRAVHLATQLWDEGDLDEEALDPVIAPYLQAWKRFRSETLFTFDSIETIVYNQTWDFAGTLDRAGYYSGYGAILDIKTVAQLSPVTGVQLAAYDLAHRTSYQDERRRFACQLRPDGTYRLREYEDSEDVHTFLAALVLHRWRLKHGRADSGPCAAALG